MKYLLQSLDQVVYATAQLPQAFENEKKRAYNTRGLKIEHGAFTPLVFGFNGAMGKEGIRFHRILAMKIADKQDKAYSTVMAWIRTKLSFSLISSSFISSFLLCLWETRTVF